MLINIKPSQFYWLAPGKSKGKSNEKSKGKCGKGKNAKCSEENELIAPGIYQIILVYMFFSALFSICISNPISIKVCVRACVCVCVHLKMKC